MSDAVTCMVNTKNAQG